MINNRQLKTLVNKCVATSFSKEGRLLDKKVKKYHQLLSSLPKSAAIAALTNYVKGINREFNKTTLEVESVVALSPVQLNQIKKAAGQNVLFVKNKINPSLFGGILVKIGDMVYNDSIEGKITQLKGVING